MFWKKKHKTKPEDSDFVCSACGKNHSGWPALTFPSPTQYAQLTHKEKETIAELNSDFCIISYPNQIDRFIRVTLIQVVNGTAGRQGYFG